MILYILNDVNNWSYLKNVEGNCNNINKITKTHYRTIYNKYVYWVKKNVFYNAFYKYICKQSINIFINKVQIYYY